MVQPLAVIHKDGILYVSNNSTAAPTIEKFQASTGQFLGWIGRVSSVTGLTPIVASGSATNGWSTGGTAQIGSGDGMYVSFRGLAVDDTYLYAAENTQSGTFTPGRIVRINLATGIFDGWIGEVATSPTGNATGVIASCTAAVDGDITPGWCMGGTSRLSNRFGGISNGALHLKVDGSFLYFSDENSSRVIKINKVTGASVATLGARKTVASSSWRTDSVYMGEAIEGENIADAQTIDYDGTYLYIGAKFGIRRYVYSTGAFAGWIGEIDSSPTGGGVSCAGAARGTITPDWCIGGYPRTGTQVGAYGSKSGGLSISGATLFSTDFTNNRIYKMNLSNGQITGWIGRVGTVVPTGDGVGNPSAGSCVATISGNATPGWCMGGTSQLGVFDGQFNFPRGGYNDGTYLYFNDSSRIVKINMTTGAFVGWFGNIYSQPTGGAAGCTTAAIGEVTPGWCTGGQGLGGGRFDTLISANRSVTSDGTYLYFPVSQQDKIMRINMATGVFAGWIGRVMVTPTGGDAGCTTALAGSFTPGWCIGGRPMGFGEGGIGNAVRENLAQLIPDNAMWSPNGIFYNGGFLYVSNTDARKLSKYNASTGQFVGWIGGVSLTPTGGTSGCTTTPVGIQTPGWCTGGAAFSYGRTNETGDFPLQGVVIGSEMVFANRGIIQRFNLSTGAFISWLGSQLVDSSSWSWVTDLDQSYTQGSWVKGLQQQAGKGLYKPRGIEIDDRYIYIAELQYPARITRWDKNSGEFKGWFGTLLEYNSCARSTTNLMTKGWCYQGEAVRDSAGGLYAPTGLLKLGNYLYITDLENRIVMRLLLN
jgi:hypothetical protein